MSPATHEPHVCDTAALNSLLQGELSAVETYTQAMSQFDDSMLITDLQHIRDEHSRAVRELRDHVILYGGVPTGDACVWDAFTATVTSGLHGTATVLAALRQGEERDIAAYDDALHNRDIHPDCQRMIRADLMPACRKHVDELNNMLGGNHN